MSSAKLSCWPSKKREHGLALTVLLFVAGLDTTARPATTTFQLNSGMPVSVATDDSPGHPLQITFSVGDSNQSVRLRPNDSVIPLERFPLRSRVISLPFMKEPLVLAYVSEAGASDCSYSVTPIGIRDGEPPLFIPFHEITLSNEGGLAIWATRSKTTLVIWSPIWAGMEGHYGAHRYEYFWYSWNPGTHKFQATRTTKSSQRLINGEEPLNLSAHSAVEISYRTRADWFPEAADGC
jgi:hypothetical protein